jgi:hypothetical protein
MSMNGMVRFGPSLARNRQIGAILHLGYIKPDEAIVTMPEGAGLLVGGGLLIAGTQVKGKGGMVMMILGGLAALAGAGSAAYRAVAQPQGAIVPLPVPPTIAPKTSTSLTDKAKEYATALAPTLTPLLKNLFAPAPAAPAPSPFTTSYT